MRLKNLSVIAALFFCLFCAVSSVRAQSQRLLELIPDLEQKLSSADVSERAGVLDFLVEIKDESCYTTLISKKDFPREDYAYVLGKIFEKDLTVIGEDQISIVFSKIGFLLKKHQLREFAVNLAEYIPKFMPESGQESIRISLEYNILDALKSLQAREFAPQIASLLNPAIGHLHQEALVTLIELRSKEAAPALTSMLRDENISKQFWAIQKLVEIDAREAAPQIALVLKSEDVNMRFWAIDALAKLNARAQAKDLWQQQKIETDKRLRGFLIVALIHLGQKEAIALFVDQLKTSAVTGEDNFTWEFVERVRPKTLVPALISLYNTRESFFADPVPEKKFREWIFRFLLDYKTLEAVPIYRQNLATKKYRVGTGMPNTDVARVLQELNVTEAVDDLIVVFNDAIKPEAGRNANFAASDVALTLAKFGDRKVWKMLVDYAEKNDYNRGSLILAQLGKHVDKKLWAQMQTRKPSLIPLDSVKLIAEISSRETGVPISFEYQSKKDAVRCKPPVEVDDKEMMPCLYIDGKSSLAEVVAAIVNRLNDDRQGQYTFVLDGGTVRILSMEKAIDWWRKNILEK